MKQIRLTGIFLIVLFLSCNKDNDLDIKMDLNNCLIPLERDIRWNYVSYYQDSYYNQLGVLREYEQNIIYQYYLDGDTVINNISYKQLWLASERINRDIQNVLTDYTYSNIYKGGIRQDTGTTKVYLFIKDKEELLYDFKIKLNDTINTLLTKYYSTLNVVSGIDSVEINKKFRKIFIIHPKEPLENYGIIEGIGITRGGLINDYGGELACFKVDGEVIYERITGQRKDIKEIVNK